MHGNGSTKSSMKRMEFSSGESDTFICILYVRGACEQKKL